MKIFKHLAAEFHVELAVKHIDSIENLVSLHFEILFRVKCFSFHIRNLPRKYSRKIH